MIPAPKKAKNTRMGRIKAAFYLMLLLAAGCATGPKYISKEFNPPRRVAVLLFANETNDVAAPDLVRKYATEILPRHGYSPMDNEEVAAVLKEKFGINEGGQLGSATPQELGKALRVDGLFYGN